MPRYDETRVPRGPTRRWEVVVADEDAQREAPATRLRATDVRSDHRVLRALEPAQLAAVPLLPEAAPLQRYRFYLDLHDPARAGFLAEGTEVVKPGQRIVAKADVPREIWDALLEACYDVTRRPRRRTA